MVKQSKEDTFDRATKAIHIRPAEPGDICVLLEPADLGEIDRLRQRQLALQAAVGGTPIAPVHLTCQRFAVQMEAELHALPGSLAPLVTATAPLPLTAVGLQTLYSPYRQTTILKWRIAVTAALRQLVAAIENALVALDIQPLYRSGFCPSLLTALEGIPRLADSLLAHDVRYPHHLLTGERIRLTQIMGPNAYQSLATFPLNAGPESTV